MNRTRIEWTDRTVNPVVGCPHGCDFCYARDQAKRQKHRCYLCYRFIVHPHLERLNQIKPTQRPLKIFIDSMWDWNSADVETSWLEEIIEKMRECRQHTFQILSKRPKRYARFVYPENVWLGASMSTTYEAYRVLDLDKVLGRNIKFVSIEPIHEQIDFWFSKVDWIIVGAETGHRVGKIVPKKEWIEALVFNAKEEGIPIFLKNNLGLPNPIQEFPNSEGRAA